MAASATAGRSTRQAGQPSAVVEFQIGQAVALDLG